MRIIWTTQALADLYAAYEYIQVENPAAAKSVIERVEKLLESLRLHPEMGRLGRVDKTRELVMPTLPFIIPYRIKGNDIQLLAFIHAARRWPEDL